MLRWSWQVPEVQELHLRPFKPDKSGYLQISEETCAIVCTLIKLIDSSLPQILRTETSESELLIDRFKNDGILSHGSDES